MKPQVHNEPPYCLHHQTHPLSCPSQRQVFLNRLWSVAFSRAFALHTNWSQWRLRQRTLSPEWAPKFCTTLHSGAASLCMPAECVWAFAGQTDSGESHVPLGFMVSRLCTEVFFSCLWLAVLFPSCCSSLIKEEVLYKVLYLTVICLFCCAPALFKLLHLLHLRDPFPGWMPGSSLPSAAFLVPTLLCFFLLCTFLFSAHFNFIFVLFCPSVLSFVPPCLPLCIYSPQSCPVYSLLLCSSLSSHTFSSLFLVIFPLISTVLLLPVHCLLSRPAVL